MLNRKEDRIMICGSPDKLSDLKAMAEGLIFFEVNNSTPIDFVIEQAFVSS
jgi:ferredoxin--NADP+ reductase